MQSVEYGVHPTSHQARILATGSHVTKKRGRLAEERSNQTLNRSPPPIAAFFVPASRGQPLFFLDRAASSSSSPLPTLSPRRFLGSSNSNDLSVQLHFVSLFRATTQIQHGWQAPSENMPINDKMVMLSGTSRVDCAGLFTHCAFFSRMENRGIPMVSG